MKKVFSFLSFALILVLVFVLNLAPSATLAAGGDTAAQFSDVFAKHANVKAIGYLRESGAVQGYGDGTFQPDRNISRAEFLKIVMEESDYSFGGSNCYPDVREQWYAKYVCAAKSHKLVDGYPDGFFRPDQNINFVEASKIIANVLDLELPTTAEDQWFASFVYALESAKAVPSDVEKFDDNLTRGQMAEIIWRLKEERTYKPYQTYTNLKAGIAYQPNFRTFESCNELHDYFEDNGHNGEEFYSYYDDVAVPSGAIRVANSMAEKGGGAGAPAADYSSTNLQESDVDEADFVKNDGEYIYMMKGNTVRIVKAYPAETMEELKVLEFEDENFYPEDMFLDGDTLVVMGKSNYYQYYNDFEKSLVRPDFFYSNGATKAFIYDISRRESPKLLREVAFEGDYKSSRKVGDKVYLVVGQDNYLWPWVDDWKEEDLVPLYTEDGRLDKLVGCEDIMYSPESIDDPSYTMLIELPLDPEEEVDVATIMGGADEYYASTDAFYLAVEKYSYYSYYETTGAKEETYIHKFDLDDEGIDYQGMTTVPGSILNQFSMDDEDGYFRIFTTNGDVWDTQNPATNNLYILNPSMQLVGKLEGLAKGERIYSARFVGDRAYLVTFKKVDPLFVIDIDDPRKPRVLGELKIPGFSDYLHPYDENHIIGFGLDTREASVDDKDARNLDFAWYQGVKIAMFDVTNVNSPKELHKVIIGDRGSGSPLLSNHKALMWSRSKGVKGGVLMGFPVFVAELAEDLKNNPKTPASTYGEGVFQGAYLYDVNPEDGFRLRGKITHYDGSEDLYQYGYYYFGGKDVQRVVYMDDVLYTVSSEMIKANDLNDPEEEISSIKLKDLNEKN